MRIHSSLSKLGAIVMVAILLAAVSPAPSATATAPATAQWLYGAPIPVALEGMMGDWLDNDTYIMSHGHDHAGDVNATYRFELANNSWHVEPNATVVRAEGVGAVAGGLFYSIGGRGPNCGGTCDDVEAFDPANGTWSNRTAMPVPVAGMGGVAVGADIWILGGRDGLTPTRGNATNLTWVYNTTTDAWSAGPDMPDARSEIQATVYASGRIWVVGGYNTTAATRLASTLVLDLSTLTWSAGPSLNSARYAAVSGRCGPDVIMVGGGIVGDAGSRTRTNTTEFLNVSASNWTYGPSMPGLGSEFSAGGGADPTSSFVMAAGSGIHGSPKNQTFVLDCDALLDPPNYPDYPLDWGDGDNPPPASCDGDGSIAGNVTSNDTAPGVLVVRVMMHGCPARVQNLTGNHTAGIPYAFTGLANGSYQVEAWWENNANNNPDAGEPIGAHPGMVDAAANRTDAHVHIGSAPPCCGDGGPFRWNGTAAWDNATANATIRLSNATNMSRDRAVNATVPGDFNVTGLHEGGYAFEAWIEQDGLPGPGPYEPRGRLVNPDGNPDAAFIHVDIHGSVSGVEIVFVPAPPGGWPPSMCG